jgi:riboflavin synthase
LDTTSRERYLCAGAAPAQLPGPSFETRVFTGIIEEVGTVRSVEPAGDGAVITVGASRVLDAMALGDSVAVDGACLTVTRILPDGFTVDAVRTTLERTTFGAFLPGRRVNLERALAFGARLGGHLVSGHVDGVGRVIAVVEEDGLTLYDVTLPEEVRGVTALHGSITLNGISLTVNAMPAAGVCQVSIIPFTREHTAIGDLRPGDAVNVEGDLIGKHVRTLLGAPGEGDRFRRGWGYA